MQIFFFNDRTYYVRLANGQFQYKPEFGHWINISDDQKKYYDPAFWKKFSNTVDAFRRWQEKMRPTTYELQMTGADDNFWD